MIFIHRVRPLPRLVAVLLLTMFGSFGLRGFTWTDIGIGALCWLLALLIIADTLRMLWMWAKSYTGRGRA